MPDASTNHGPQVTSPAGMLEAGLAGGGQLRWVAVDLTAPVEFIRRRRDLSPISSAALGRSLAGAAMLLRLASKTPQRLVLEIRGDGPLRKVMAEAEPSGNLRGLVAEPRVDLPPYPGGKLAVGKAIGHGILQVLREYDGGGSYHSQVELVSGEIGADLAHYLRQSEQTPSAVMVGVLTRPDGVAAAGGLIIEALPNTNEATFARLEANLGGHREVSRLLEAGGVAALKEACLGGLDAELRETQAVRYHCRCSRERLLGHLLGLSAEQLEELALGEEVAQAECGFCGEVYFFQPSELRPQ
ncbi:MAG TPA: Hsp33 family molecular chaperone HslO [Thermoanaerobaculia bacterium]|jgi:molecular chaperone Hsp33|nr:Hsp33 family molecular chaperone HslO [Thermoanaerobaculia bacterium]